MQNMLQIPTMLKFDVCGVSEFGLRVTCGLATILHLFATYSAIVHVGSI